MADQSFGSFQPAEINFSAKPPPPPPQPPLLPTSVSRPPTPTVRTSRLAIASLFFGFLMVYVTGLPALALGIPALVAIRRSGGHLRGRWLAIAGICLGSLWVLNIPATFIIARLVSTKSQHGISSAQNEIKSFEMALSLYELDNGELPTTEDGLQALIAAPTGSSRPERWKGPYVKPPIKTDPWDQPYIYVSPGKWNPKTFDLYSSGPDRVPETEDDIKNWQ